MKEYLKNLFTENPCAKWFAGCIFMIWVVAFLSLAGLPTALCLAGTMTAVLFGIFGLAVALND